MAVLLAEACNIGLEPVVRSDHPALTRARLSWVQQNYIRAETLTRANACLVDAQSTIDLAQVWGGGDVASADGLRFVVPVRTLNAGPNRKYFNADRGVTYYNSPRTNSPVSMPSSSPAPCATPCISSMASSTIKRGCNRGRSWPTRRCECGCFGLFWLLGYQFSPRMADLGKARFWRLGPRGRLRRPRWHRPGSCQYKAHQPQLGRLVAGCRVAASGHGECLQLMVTALLKASVPTRCGAPSRLGTYPENPLHAGLRR